MPLEKLDQRIEACGESSKLKKSAHVVYGARRVLQIYGQFGHVSHFYSFFDDLSAKKMVNLEVLDVRTDGNTVPTCLSAPEGYSSLIARFPKLVRAKKYCY